MTMILTTGSKLVSEAGMTMTEIVTSVKQVTDIMADIMAASQEQSAGIEQVNQAVSAMDQATQQNASLVEQAANSSGSLQEQAVRLAGLVSVFRLDNSPAPVLVRPLPSSPAYPPASRQVAPARRQTVAAPAARQGEWEEF